MGIMTSLVWFSGQSRSACFIFYMIISRCYCAIVLMEHHCKQYKLNFSCLLGCAGNAIDLCHSLLEDPIAWFVFHDSRDIYDILAYSAANASSFFRNLFEDQLVGLHSI